MSAKVNVKVNGRPRVVIDPEDREQVTRLADAFERTQCSRPVVDRMRDSLRSLIADPKPTEPQGWGAVVEDRDGWYWTLVAPDSGAWANYGQRGYRKWDEITAVRVLSEGVTS